MNTFRKLSGDVNKKLEAGERSSLERWFDSVVDVPIEDLAVEDICRAIRQKNLYRSFNAKSLVFDKEKSFGRRVL
ncbi:contact-dependent growth inhibition system immunity protein [Acerihabitans sp. KWT182]|uniref:Contact-dependent growth inhibition system immunity protein n=1 Tax=Acerihabitans sp. KWT182 TaxID=3157919 RepID=A0AAU7QF65_9GAMM